MTAMNLTFFAAITLTLLFLTTCQTTATQDFTPNFQAGVAARLQKDYAKALKHWRPIAKQGYAGAQFNLGNMHRLGLGVTKDHKEAVRWYRKAAMQGDAHAQGSLGVMYDRGHGVTQDLREAVKWYRKAANQGYVNVQSILGHMYANGRGVMHDDIMAYVWFNVAAMNENDDAIENRDHVSKRLSESDLKKAQKLSKHCHEKPASCPKYSDDQRQSVNVDGGMYMH